MKIIALIPAAGTGSRMGSAVPKQFLSLDKRPIVVHTLQAFETTPEIQEIFLIVPPSQEDRCYREWVEVFGLKKVTRLIPGGPHRQDSVYAGLQDVPLDTEIVVVHDGVRPFVTGAMIRQAIEGASRYGSAVVAIPVKDTLKAVDSDGYISATLNRSSMWLAQTPQAFLAKVLMEAYQRAYSEGVVQTDDAALVERLGYRVRIIPGSLDNLKITEPEDLLLAERILKLRRVP